jgi:hypothetical protein
VLDGDAWEAGRTIAKQLVHRGIRAGHVRLPARTDPDEVPLDELRAEAVSSLDRS